MTGRVVVLAVLVAMAVLLLAEASGGEPARAAFPGANGKITFVSDRDGNREGYVMNADGSGQTNLTNNTADDEDPAWSADGTKIAFASDRDGNFEIYVMDADGSDVQRLTDDPSADDNPSWAPDDANIAFRSERSGYGNVHVITNDGTYYAQLTRFDFPGIQGGPAWSPNGHWIAYSSPGAVIVVRPDGTEYNTVSPGIGAPDWSPDGSWLGFSSFGATGDRFIEVAAVNADSGLPTGIGGSIGVDVLPFSKVSWSPDGYSFAFARGTGSGDAEIALMNRDGTNPRELTSNDALDTDPSWQPLPAGDVNCAGGVNAIDALLLLQLAAGRIDSLACEERADVNDDGRVDSVDAALILQYDAGLIESLA